MAIDPLIEAANHFFVNPRQIKLLGDSSGYSDSRFAEVTDHQGQGWCLRGWSDSTEEGMRFIHQVLLHSRTHGFAGLPKLAYTKTGESLLLLANVWFEAQEWLAGGPLYQVETPATKQRIPNMAWAFTAAERQAVVAALAAFHTSTATLQPLVSGPSVQAQIRLVVEQAQRQMQVAAEIVCDGSSTDDQRLVAQWLMWLPILVNCLQARSTADWEELADDNVACHGDLWPAHVYFRNGAFRGFVDFGALTFTTPALDLAHLILHFGGWQSCDEVVAVYTNSRPLSAHDRRVIAMMALADLVSEGYWSLGQLCNDSTPPHAQAAHRHNLRFFRPSAEALVKELS